MTNPRMVVVLVEAVIKQSKWTKTLLYLQSKRRVQQGSFTEETELEYFFTSRECTISCSGKHDGKRISSQKHEKEERREASGRCKRQEDSGSSPN
jgi:hypothetical protein